jgi:hypothetical protein
MSAHSSGFSFFPLCVCVKIEKLVNCEDRLDNDDPALLRHGEFLRAKLFSWQEF